MTYEWSVAKIAFVEESYAIGDTVQFKFKDKDLGGSIGKDKTDLDFRIWSDSDHGRHNCEYHTRQELQNEKTISLYVDRP